MSRAASANEVTKLANSGQWSNVYAVIASPVTVFAARVNQVFTSVDKIASITFDTVTTGAYTDILPGMTILVGSSAGASDRGIGCVRKTATATILYITETSTIAVADNDYITVLQEFSLWSKNARVTNNGVNYYVNYDETYTDQLGTPKPVIICGGDRVIELISGSAATTYDLTGCYVIDASSVASYVTTCPGTTVTNGTTSAPTVTASSTGQYLVKFQVTATNGKVSITYRWLFVWDASGGKSSIILNDNTADMTGWTASVTLYGDLSAVRPRAKCVVFAKDYYTLNEIQTITLGGTPTGGTFTLTYSGQTTGNITWSSTNATLLSNILAALRALSNIGDEDVTVTAGTLTAGIGSILITFTGLLANTDVATMTYSSSLTGTAPTIAISETVKGNGAGSFGALTGCENIIIDGWIAEDGMIFDAIKGEVKFFVRQAGYFLDQEQSQYEVPLIQTSSTPNAWHHIQTLTVDKMLWHLLENYTTALNCMDFTTSGDTRTALSMTAPIGSLWQQITVIADSKIKANVSTNQYGQLFAFIDTPLIPYASRSTIPVVVTLTKTDFETIDVTQVILPPTSQVILNGLLADGSAVCSIGGGRQLSPWGIPLQLADMLASTQATFNVLAGSIYARENNPYKFLIRNLRGNNRLIDICPNQRIGLTLTGADNLRGITYSDYIVIRAVTRSHNPQSGEWTIDLDADAETQAALYVTGDIPVIDAYGNTNNYSFPAYPSYNLGLGGITFPFPTTPVSGTYVSCPDGSPRTGPYYLEWSPKTIDGLGVLSAKAWFPCTVRASTATYPTELTFRINNRGYAYAHLHVYGIDVTGNRILTGTVYADGWGGTDIDNLPITVTFAPAGPVNVAGFEVAVDEGADTGGATFDFTYGKNDGAIYDGSVATTVTITTFGTAGALTSAKIATSGTIHQQSNPIYGVAVDHQLTITATANTSLMKIYNAITFAGGVSSDGPLKMTRAVHTGTWGAWREMTEIDTLGSVYEIGLDVGSSVPTTQPDGVFKVTPKAWAHDTRTFNYTLWLLPSGAGTPVRTATLGTGLLTNVCPAV